MAAPLQGFTGFRGCLTAIVTPFRNGAVDHAALEAFVNWQIEAGIDGLVAVGTTGESATLSVEEHIAVVQAVVRIAGGRVPVIAGAGANATAEAIELSQRAADVGANGLLHVTPYYNKPTQDGLFAHYAAIAQSTTLPILLYNVPSRTSCDLLPVTVERLAAIDNIIGIKDATGSLPRYTELLLRVGNRMTVLSGDDATAFPLYTIGGHGVISVISNIAPAKMAQMWDLTRAGQWTTAAQIHMDLHNLIGLLFAETSPAPVKAALAMRGRIQDELRLPLVPVSAALAERLKAELGRLELL